jgi:hypothetical protein
MRKRDTPETYEEARERFESYLESQENGCINWTGNKDKDGYGRIQFNRKAIKSHRFAWLLAGNTLPPGLVMRHKCVKNRSCCNVEHLELGTPKDNSHDAMRDGTLTKGEDVNTSKLTADMVLQIRARPGMYQKDLGKEFGVGQSTIGRILSREIWKHI